MLYDVLENVGVSLENRDLWKEHGLTREILFTISSDQHAYSVYHFGSFTERTTTREMNPDMDTVVVGNIFPVVSDYTNYRTTDCLYLIQDNSQEPGYAKLQPVLNGVPMFQNVQPYNSLPIYSLSPVLHICPDNDNRLVCCYSPILEPGDERHGPALTTTYEDGSLNLDHVDALNCSEWPECAAEWLTRKRYNTWPSQHMIDTCKSLGFLLVTVGHPQNAERDKQWRLSFSH